MDIIKLLADKVKKPTEKRAELVGAINEGTFTVDSIAAVKDGIDEKGTGLILEAMEAVTNGNPAAADLKWLNFAEVYISSANNTVKREASRVVGNIAHIFPDNLEPAVQKLLVNAADGGTVIRWGSAYALSKIILIPRYAKSNLYDVLTELAEKEQDNAVKNQYLNGLKKAKKSRGE